MFTINYEDTTGETIEVVVSGAKHLMSLARILEKSQVKFLVFSSGQVVLPPKSVETFLYWVSPPKNKKVTKGTFEANGSSVYYFKDSKGTKVMQLSHTRMAEKAASIMNGLMVAVRPTCRRTKLVQEITDRFHEFMRHEAML